MSLVFLPDTAMPDGCVHGRIFPSSMLCRSSDLHGIFCFSPPGPGGSPLGAGWERNNGRRRICVSFRPPGRAGQRARCFRKNQGWKLFLTIIPLILQPGFSSSRQRTILDIACPANLCIPCLLFLENEPFGAAWDAQGIAERRNGHRP